MGRVDLTTTTVHGEAGRVLALLKEPDSIEFWYAEILHGVVPRPWLNAWVTSRSARSPARFGGVLLSAGPFGEILLSIPPEIIDHPLSEDEVVRLLG
ncbi:hypothetical protein [Kineosporia succinea]|uniref:Uncharacterized protein n=1 Tax=Kineosporia succinea TaxID=84632 RepID=A0ABT9PAQ5_9ACTN|nr:hypothetical protein [Kineosporia succinea]MDP9829130.1 hypothetical protein [Kineosporia succinea]